MITTAATYCTKFTVRHADVEQKPLIKTSARRVSVETETRPSQNECGGDEVDAEEEVLHQPDPEAAHRHHKGEHGERRETLDGRVGHCQGAKGKCVSSTLTPLTEELAKHRNRKFAEKPACAQKRFRLSSCMGVSHGCGCAEGKNDSLLTLGRYANYVALLRVAISQPQPRGGQCSMVMATTQTICVRRYPGPWPVDPDRGRSR